MENQKFSGNLVFYREGNKQQSNESAINIFYSTPSCYLKAVHDEKLSYSVKDDDFFPYASDPHSYWTGYFTSRPTIKFYERMGNNYMQVGLKGTLLIFFQTKVDSEFFSDFRLIFEINQENT